MQRDLLFVLQQDHRPEKAVPARHDAEQRNRRDGWLGQRYIDLPKDLDFICAVHAGGFLKRAWNTFEKVAQQDDVKAVDGKADDDAEIAVEQTKVPHVQEKRDHPGVEPHCECDHEVPESPTKKPRP